MPFDQPSSLPRRTARLLDRSGGRTLLGILATRYSKRFPEGSSQIGYSDGLWTHRSGPYIFVDGPEFDFTRAHLERLGSWVDLFSSGTKENWFRRYAPKEGDVILDVGAGRGEDAFTFSRAVGATGRVIAIEAHPVNYAILKRFSELNQLTNVIPLHLAAMDKPGTARISDEKSKWMAHSVQPAGTARGFDVPAATLDQICKDQAVDRIALLKMNIEGAERSALQGIGAMISRVQNICVACHDFKTEKGEGDIFRTRDYVETFLRGHGFATERRADDPRPYIRDHIVAFRHP